MPVHDWTRVEAGIFHAFPHVWMTEIARLLNRELLPDEYYALPEQRAMGFGPDGLTLQAEPPEAVERPSSSGNVMLAPPTLQPTAETDFAFYRRKQKFIVVRHTSGDRIVAVIEILSPGNKAARHPLRSFLTKAAELLERQVHMLILDLLPPGAFDPQGIHAELWQEIAGESYELPSDKPLTCAAYESGPSLRAYVQNLTVGDPLPEMPLFLEPEQAISIPLERAYTLALEALPRRWVTVLEATD